MTKRTFKVKASGLDDFGRGIYKDKNQTIFIPDFLPGEEAEIETEYRYGKLSDVKVKKRLKTSPDRQIPPCPYYPSCGGCQLLHLNYQSQLIYKREKVKSLLHKFAHLDFPVSDTVPCVPHYNFRNKVQKPARKIKGKVELGFYKTNTHDFIPIKKCLMETELSQRISDAVKELLNKYHYDTYDEDKGTGYIRHVLIKTSLHYEEALVTIVTTNSELKGRTNFAKDLMSKVKEVKGVVFNVNPRHTNVILGEKTIPIYGYTHIKDKIFDNDFLISTKSFFQTNSYQIENLYRLGIEGAQLKPTDVVLDAYCGTGTIGISASKYCKQVIGVELEKEAVKDAIRNARINDIENIKFFCADCTDYMLKSQTDFDVIFLDPPRKGSTPEFLNAVNKLEPRRVVYISCEPNTLARDLNILLKKYKVEKVTPVDMFPNTCSVETVVILSKK